jgi:hypothetical protein
MIGEPPNSEHFQHQFGWTDAVIHCRFDCADIGAVLAGLDADPQRLGRIRRQNIHNAALQHDWLHRLQAVFTTLGIEPTAAMRLREQQLQALAVQALGLPIDECAHAPAG